MRLCLSGTWCLGAHGPALTLRPCSLAKSNSQRRVQTISHRDASVPHTRGDSTVQISCTCPPAPSPTLTTGTGRHLPPSTFLILAPGGSETLLHINPPPLFPAVPGPHDRGGSPVFQLADRTMPFPSCIHSLLPISQAPGPLLTAPRIGLCPISPLCPLPLHPHLSLSLSVPSLSLSLPQSGCVRPRLHQSGGADRVGAWGGHIVSLLEPYQETEVTAQAPGWNFALCDLAGALAESQGQRSQETGPRSPPALPPSSPGLLQTRRLQP